ncbi:MAG: porin family protein, partial [Methylobacteriaceae bacterium]|nr:porin family protein [Methylobacteriaceae bacterium]
MGSLKALTLAGGVALAASTVARAADLPPPPPPEPAPIVAADFGGWYLRGDVGIGMHVGRPALRTTPDPLATGAFNGCDGAGGTGNCYTGATYGAYNFLNPNISRSTFVGLGVGYQLNHWLRADATLEFRGGAHLQAVDQLLETGTYTFVNADGTIGFGPAAYSRPLRNFYRGSVSSIVAMINGYVDLGTWHGVTPYVGVGVGLARNTISGLTDQGFSYNSLNGVGSPTGGFWTDGHKTNFAWALMAGLGYSVSSNLKLELGYRYMNLGKMTSGASRCFNGTGAGGGFAPCSIKISTGSIDSHDVRIGMRWMLGE